MASDAMTEASGTRTAGFNRGAAVTRSLLGYGVLVGPFYLAVGLIQAFVRDGYDFSRHALSHLANGPGGWVQTANFALSGLMVIAAAVGFARVLRESRAASWILGLYGVSLLAAALFPADPVDGFPPGTPEGPPTTISTTGLLHFAAGGIGFLALAVSCFVVGRAMWRRHEPVMARLSLLAGLAVVVGFFGPMMLPMGNIGIAAIWFAVVVGWAWLAVTSVHLYRASPHPDC